MAFLRAAKVSNGALEWLIDGRVGTDELLLQLILRDSRFIAVLSSIILKVVADRGTQFRFPTGAIEDHMWHIFGLN